jgi:hypothetical protein
LPSVNPIAVSRRPVIVGVGGFTSEVGKTTLLCDLLRAFPGWEAIKMTRGHYRSCGKDPHVCCVSDLLETEVVIRSGPELTDSPGKDTGRYWESGAANVHWVIATDQQVEDGIKKALSRVQGPGVFIEGNSFTNFIEPDFFVMVVRADDLKIKTTAREALSRVSAFYVSGDAEARDKEFHRALLAKSSLGPGDTKSRVFVHSELPDLIALMSETIPRSLNIFWQPAPADARLKLP